MKLTAAHRKAINTKGREILGGSFDHIEVGSRHNIERDDGTPPPPGIYFNLVHLDRSFNDDLWDIVRLRDLKEIEDHPSGEAEVDCYVYGRINHYYSRWARKFEYDVQLETNITATFKNGQLVEVFEP